MRNPQKNTSEPVTTVGDVLSWLIHWKLLCFFWGLWKPELHPPNRNSINYVPCIWPTPRHLRPSVARADRIPSSPARRPPSPRGRASGRLVEEGKMLTAKMKAVTTSTRWADFPCQLVQNTCQIGSWKCWKVKLVRSGPGSFNKKQGLLICLWKGATCRVIFRYWKRHWFAGSFWYTRFQRCSGWLTF